MDTSAGKNYTAYLKPANILLDVVAIMVLHKLFFSSLATNGLHFVIYQVILWNCIAYFSGFYEIYRYLSPVKIIYKSLQQTFIFLIAILGFFLFARYTVLNLGEVAKYFACLISVVFLLKTALYSYIKSRPLAVAGRSIIIGHSSAALELREIISIKEEFFGFFSDKQGKDIAGNINMAIAFAQSNALDTIYCSLKEISPSKREMLTSFAVESGINLKFIPDTGDIFPKSFRIDYYESFPLLSMHKTPLHDPVAQIGKRLFDILFSGLVIIFILSWLTPIIALFIKLESKGPVFFKQGRPGIDESEFMCYKFRSMGVNRNPEAMAVKNDARVTKIGKFLRKTSLDELPQFFNVFLGEMSVVGPRPQLWFHNNEYKLRIHKFTNRLYVKPGITGLAQVSGYRGEINSDSDMQNRVRYDVFYIENWSMLLDLRIIIQTVVNIFLGEEKAY